MVGSSTFRRPKTDGVLTSRWTGFDLTRERVQGRRSQPFKSELRRSRLDRGVRSRLQMFYRITLKLIVPKSLLSSFGLFSGSNRALGVL